MSMTIAEKILAAHSGKEAVEPSASFVAGTATATEPSREAISTSCFSSASHALS